MCAEAADAATGPVPAGQKGRNVLVGDIDGIPDRFASLELVRQELTEEQRRVAGLRNEREAQRAMLEELVLPEGRRREEELVEDEDNGDVEEEDHNINR